MTSWKGTDVDDDPGQLGGLTPARAGGPVDGAAPGPISPIGRRGARRPTSTRRSTSTASGCTERWPRSRRRSARPARPISTSGCRTSIAKGCGSSSPSRRWASGWPTSRIPSCRRRWCKAWNDWAVETVIERTDRVLPSAILPFLSVDDAVAELQRATELGFRAVFLPSVPPGGHDYALDRWEPLWSAVEETGIVLALPHRHRRRPGGVPRARRSDHQLLGDHGAGSARGHPPRRLRRPRPSSRTSTC